MEKLVKSILANIKKEDGTFDPVFFINTLNDVYYDINSNKTLNDAITDGSVSKDIFDSLSININKLKRSEISDDPVTITVSPSGDDDLNDGLSPERPLKTLRRALGMHGGLNRIFIKMMPGIYEDDNPIVVSGNGYVSISSSTDNYNDVIIKFPLSFLGGHVGINHVTIDTSTFNYLNDDNYCILCRHCSFSVGVNKIIGNPNLTIGVNVRFGSTGYISTNIINNNLYAIGVETGSIASCYNNRSDVDNGNGTAYRSTNAIILIEESTNNILSSTQYRYGSSGLIFSNGILLGSTANTFATATI